jgi:hypothetical protein
MITSKFLTIIKRDMHALTQKKVVPEVVYNYARGLAEASTKKRERIIPPFAVGNDVPCVKHTMFAHEGKEPPCKVQNSTSRDQHRDANDRQRLRLEEIDHMPGEGRGGSLDYLSFSGLTQRVYHNHHREQTFRRQPFCPWDNLPSRAPWED